MKIKKKTKKRLSSKYILFVERQKIRYYDKFSKDIDIYLSNIILSGKKLA